MIRKFILISLLLAGLSHAAAAAPYHAGLDEITLTDPVTGRSVRAALWYPTQAAPGPVRRGPFLLQVSEGAKPADGPFPLILFSHGNGGSPFSHRDSGQALAEAGFIVAAPLHAGDNFQDSSLLGTESLLKSRPATISALLDRLLIERPGLVDEGRIGFAGFSAGGYTGLALLGAKPAYAQFAVHCRNFPGDRFCRYAPRGAIAPVKLEGLADPRIRAAALMAPVAAFFDDDSLRSITAPVFLIRAEKDQILADPYHGARVAGGLAAIREDWVINGAGHFSFLAPFPEAIRADVGEIALDAPGFDRAAMHEMLNRRLVRFFEGSL